MIGNVNIWTAQAGAERGVEERLCTCPKMVGCNEPITARSSRFPSWLRRVRIPILCSSSKWEHHRTRHSSYHHFEQEKPATIPGLIITGRGRSVLSPLDNMTHPGHLGKPAPEAGGGAVCSRAPLPSNLPALPWSDLAVPGPCERSARPNTTGYVGPPISSRPCLRCDAVAKWSDGLFGHRQPLGLFAAVPLARRGGRGGVTYGQQRPSFSYGVEHDMPSVAQRRASDSTNESFNALTAPV